MIFEFKQSGVGILAAFAAAIGSKLENDTVLFPKHLGKGYIKGIKINPRLRMMIRQYELYEQLIIRRTALEDGANFVVMAFHNLYRGAHLSKSNPMLSSQCLLPSAQITTAGINYEDFFPVNTKVNSIIITVHIDFLKELLNPQAESTFLQNIFSGSHPFLYEEIVSPAMQDIAAQMLDAKVSVELQDFYYRLKAEELIFLFFAELIKRQDTAPHSLNIADVKGIYQVRDKIISDLSITPNLSELAKLAAMSESKVKRLFKNVFGYNIYDYYQSLRMKEAARLLKEEQLSVSEAGYQLGFSNLSHFTRVFERYIGMKPKKYSNKDPKKES